MSLLLAWLVACGTSPPADPCAGDAALAGCLVPRQDPAHYLAQADLYFDTMEFDSDPERVPTYSELVARWEWPPWLKLTGYGRQPMIDSGLLLRLFPAQVPTRECLAFEVQPFARCRVVFTYEEYPDRACPIYEEFVFNDLGEVTFIEAWSDLPGMRPMRDDDPWAEDDDLARLATRVPGLGRVPDGLIDLGGAAMTEAAAQDPDVADFVARASNFEETWAAEYLAAGDDLFARGCGWTDLIGGDTSP